MHRKSINGNIVINDMNYRNYNEFFYRPNNKLNVNEKRCVAILTRKQDESGIEKLGSSTIIWNSVSSILDMDCQNVYDLLQPLMYLYKNDRERISFGTRYHKYEIGGCDIDMSKNVICEKFDRRMCIVFNLTQNNLEKLLSSPTYITTQTMYYGEKVEKKEINQGPYNQLMTYCTHATFEFKIKDSEKWLVYKTYPPLEFLEAREEADCKCRLF